MSEIESCMHQKYRCLSCNSLGCKWRDCAENLIRDSCDPHNDNFEHGTDSCLRCGATATRSDGADAFVTA